ncbi:hypothetical protein PHLGIDRAFT_167406 [Phlebiopsis gigantea 11061_1 CR5-6]|uniref:BZIP domain-containing protein n=1 Tax=Phlebiopsis gigantea (strain 11061_1 CR5-6) TaxID=745531 RepID=A0A0C3S856_PHLG1|nr:hypothetical protein PHLGIDRAFT_167406 [Phlebiopsis gigantea 11061_1 CR5-6]
MTRGRRKDLSIPPSRALLQQRDYRARKAQYLNDLEDRARRAEEENVRLRKELDVLRLRAAAPGSMGPSPDVVTASSELMHQLTAAAACLARFQQLTFTEHHQAQAAAQAHALDQTHLQTHNLQSLPPPPPDLPLRPELPPIRDLPPNESHVLPPPSAVYSGRPSPPRSSLHPSRHQQPTLFHQHHHHHHNHHQQLSPPPLHVPGSNSDSRRDFAVLHPPLQSETPRQTPVPSSSSASSSTSVSTSPSTLQTRLALTSTSAHTSSYAGYNEIETAWGYFDSRDLGVQDEDEEEDELDEDDDRSRRASLHRRGRGSPGDSRHPSSRMSPRTSDVRSTASSSGPEDTPMRMREDSPMRTR